MTLLTSVGLLGAVVLATYVFCVRPMRRGAGSITQVVRRAFGVEHAVRTVTDVDADLESARHELAQLRGRAQLSAPATNKRDSSVTGRNVWGTAALAGPVTLERSARTSSRSKGVTGWRRYCPVNMSRAEQVARVAAGLVIAAITGAVVPGAVAGAWGVSLVVLGWLAVADLVVSGLIGHCPLHRFVRLPWDPRART